MLLHQPTHITLRLIQVQQSIPYIAADVITIKVKIMDLCMDHGLRTVLLAPADTGVLPAISQISGVNTVLLNMYTHTFWDMEHGLMSLIQLHVSKGQFPAVTVTTAIPKQRDTVVGIPGVTGQRLNTEESVLHVHIINMKTMYIPVASALNVVSRIN